MRQRPEINNIIFTSGTVTVFDTDPEVSVDADLSAIWLDDPGRHGWAVGAEGTILELQKDGRWHLRPVDGDRQMATIDFSSVWACGDGRQGWIVGEDGAILQLQDDGAWTLDEKGSAQTEEDLLAIWVDDECRNGWAVGDAGVILRLEEGEWKIYSDPELPKSRLSSLWVKDNGKDDLQESGGEGWAVGSDFTILRLSSGRWVPKKKKRMPNIDLRAVWGADGIAGPVWAVGESGMAVRLSDEVKKIGWLPIAPVDLTSVWVNREGSGGWAAGEDGTVLRLRGESWQETPLASAEKNVDLSMVWSAGGDPNVWGWNVWVLGDQGTILRLTPIKSGFLTLTLDSEEDQLKQLQGSYQLIGNVDSESEIRSLSEIKILCRGMDECEEHLKKGDQCSMHLKKGDQYEILDLDPDENLFKLSFTDSAKRLTEEYDNAECSLFVVSDLTRTEGGVKTRHQVEFEMELPKIQSPGPSWYKTSEGVTFFVGLVVMTYFTFAMLSPVHFGSQWVPPAIFTSSFLGVFFKELIPLIDPLLLFSVVGVWSMVLVGFAVVRADVFKGMARVVLFWRACAILLHFPLVRKNVYRDYVARMSQQKFSIKISPGEFPETYVELPAALSYPKEGDPSGSVEVEGPIEERQPAEAIMFRLRQQKERDRIHICIEAAGGLGKTAVVRAVVRESLQAFKHNPRSLLPIVSEGNSTTLQDVVVANFKKYKVDISPRLIKGEIEAGKYLVVFDDDRENGYSAKSMASLLSEAGISVSVLFSVRPLDKYRETLLENSPNWLLVEPSAIGQPEDRQRFVASYTKGLLPDLSARSLDLCRATDGRILPALAWSALYVDAGMISPAGFYRKVFNNLLRGQDRYLEDWLARHCVETYWQTGNTKFSSALGGQEVQDAYRRLLAAGVLVPEVGSFRGGSDVPGQVKFRHDSMRDYLTIVGLNLANRPLKDVLREAAGRFAPPSQDGSVQEVSRLFRMCTLIYSSLELTKIMREHLVSWAKKFGAELIRSALSEQRDISTSDDAKVVMEAAVERCLELEGGTQALADFYGQLAPHTWRLGQIEINRSPQGEA